MAVALADVVTEVGLATAEIVVPAGTPLPEMRAPTSSSPKAAVADVTVGDALVVAPSDTDRVANPEQHPEPIAA